MLRALTRKFQMAPDVDLCRVAEAAPATVYFLSTSFAAASRRSDLQSVAVECPSRAIASKCCCLHLPSNRADQASQQSEVARRSHDKGSTDITILWLLRRAARICMHSPQMPGPPRCAAPSPATEMTAYRYARVDSYCSFCDDHVIFACCRDVCCTPGFGAPVVIESWHIYMLVDHGLSSPSPSASQCCFRVMLTGRCVSGGRTRGLCSGRHCAAAVAVCAGAGALHLAARLLQPAKALMYIMSRVFAGGCPHQL